MSEKTVVPTQTLRVASPEHPFRFECGKSLTHLDVAFETYGELNSAGDNAVYVCHALTGSAHAAFFHAAHEERPGWWDGLIGRGKALDPERYFIVCANLLGSCYGTTGPASSNPETGQPFGMAFPPVTTRDMVNLQKSLLDLLGVKQLALVLGGSLGGMLTWQWLVDYPEFVRAAIPIAGSVQGSPWMIALNEVARQAIYNDPAWCEGTYADQGPVAGLALARMIAMISYRSHAQFARRFGRDRVHVEPSRALDFHNRFQVESYLHYQGQKLVSRFDARSYIYLTKAMDLHDVARGYASLEEALARLQAEVLVIGIDSDVLYFPSELQETVGTLQRLGKRAAYRELHSIYGHDAFLVEYDQLNKLVGDFLRGRN
ncbi:MAG: homoserine O-acetyltransferase [bacterium]|jgi:homoserine O-acetyltransferase|nr:homoserine O-acetyltransferase [candidate division KSB1 bacterium]MDH7561318.1 homoserine O-acetyltransferase [bacterium]